MKSAVVVGMGVVAPGAAGLAQLEASLGGGPPAEPVVKEIGDEANPRAKRLPKLDRMVMAAAREALGERPAPAALVFGTGYGGLSATVDFLEGMAARGPQFGSPTAFHQSVHHAPAGQLSIALGITGPSLTTSAREVSGESALKLAWDLLATGRVPQVLVVAADERVPALLGAYRSFGALSAGGGGLVPGEGAAAVLLAREGDGPVVERVELSGEPATTLRFPEAPAPLLGLLRRAGERAGPAPLVSPAGLPGAVGELERRVLDEALPGHERVDDYPRFGVNPSGGLLRLVAMALRLQRGGRSRRAVVHGVSLGGAHGAVVLKDVSR